MDRRAEFPILSTMLGKRRLVYLDNAATTLNPLHAWQDMTDMEILESCRLIKKNEAGEIEGFK